MGKQCLAETCGMRRIAAADGRRDPKRPARLDLLDVDGLATVEDGQMAGLAGVTNKAFKERRRFLPQIHLCKDLAAKFEDAKTQPVAAGRAVALEQARRLAPALIG